MKMVIYMEYFVQKDMMTICLVIFLLLPQRQA